MIAVNHMDSPAKMCLMPKCHRAPGMGTHVLLPLAAPAVGGKSLQAAIVPMPQNCPSGR